MVSPAYLFDDLRHLALYLREHAAWHLEGGRGEAGAAFEIAALIVVRAMFKHPLDEFQILPKAWLRDPPDWLVKPITVNDVLEWERKAIEDETSLVAEDDLSDNFAISTVQSKVEKAQQVAAMKARLRKRFGIADDLDVTVDWAAASQSGGQSPAG